MQKMMYYHKTGGIKVCRTICIIQLGKLTVFSIFGTVLMPLLGLLSIGDKCLYDFIYKNVRAFYQMLFKDA